MVHTSDSICGRCIHIDQPYMPIKHLIYKAYMPNLMGIFVSDTYLAVTCEVDIAAGFLLVNLCQNVQSII